MSRAPRYFFFFFFNDTATTEIYTLSLHDALPIFTLLLFPLSLLLTAAISAFYVGRSLMPRSEEHTSELQSQSNLVCRLLLEKKKTKPNATDALSNVQPMCLPITYTSTDLRNVILH